LILKGGLLTPPCRRSIRQKRKRQDRVTDEAARFAGCRRLWTSSFSIADSVSLSKSERHAKSARGDHHLDSRAHRPARLWASAICKAPRANRRCSPANRTNKAGCASARGCTPESCRRWLRRSKLCATWNALRESYTASRGSHASNPVGRVTLYGISLLQGVPVSRLLLALRLERSRFLTVRADFTDRTPGGDRSAPSTSSRNSGRIRRDALGRGNSGASLDEAL
jgi:hypothetical protein